MTAEDVDAVRLPVALRGYRFAETDQLLDRLAGELRARDAELALLRGALPAEPAGVVSFVKPSPVEQAPPAQTASEVAAPPAHETTLDEDALLSLAAPSEEQQPLFDVADEPEAVVEQREPLLDLSDTPVAAEQPLTGA